MVKNNFSKNSLFTIVGVLVVLVVGFLGTSSESITGQAPRPAQTCSDPDGRDYFTAGTTTRGSRTEPDTCQRNNNEVKEFYCENNDIRNFNFPCPQGCSNGACLSKPQQGAATSCDADAICEANKILSKTIDADSVGSNNVIVQDIIIGGSPTMSNMISTRQGINTPLVLASSAGEVFIQDVSTALPGPLGKLMAGAAQIGSLLFDGKTVSTLPGSTSDLVLKSDTGFVRVEDRLKAKVLYADAFKLGESQGCNPGLVYNGAQFGGAQPCGSIEINSKAAFRDNVEFVTAYADNFKARNHVSADIMTVVSARAQLNPPGADNAFACFDKYGQLFRSDTSCR